MMDGSLPYPDCNRVYTCVCYSGYARSGSGNTWRCKITAEELRRQDSARKAAERRRNCEERCESTYSVCSSHCYSVNDDNWLWSDRDSCFNACGVESIRCKSRCQ